ncbi:hypothetical protein [Bacillus subtilis]
MAYIFHEMDERTKDVPRTKVEHIEDQCKHKKLYIPNPKEKKKANKKEKGENPSPFAI